VTKTRGMIYSSNVSDKNKGYGILLEWLRQTQRVWYTPRISQTKTRVMVYSANENFEEYILPLVFFWDIRGVYHNPCVLLRTSRSIYYPLFFSETWYDILLEFLKQKQGLWYILRMSQTKTRGIIYSSNISEKNKGYAVLLECLRQRVKHIVSVYNAHTSYQIKNLGKILRILQP
jgi:hypothetical protein